MFHGLRQLLPQIPTGFPPGYLENRLINNNTIPPNYTLSPSTSSSPPSPNSSYSTPSSHPINQINKTECTNSILVVVKLSSRMYIESCSFCAKYVFVLFIITNFFPIPFHTANNKKPHPSNLNHCNQSPTFFQSPNPLNFQTPAYFQKNH